jgi:hypothetical protein
MLDSYPSRWQAVMMGPLLLILFCGAQVLSQPAGRSITLPRGTRIEVSLLQGLSTKQSQEGEQFAAVLEKDLIQDGIAVLPKGVRAIGTVSRVKRPGRFRGKAELSLSFDVIRFSDGREEPLVATISQVRKLDGSGGQISPEGEIKGPGSAGHDAGMIIAGGATGAGIGALAGGGRGAAIGSAAGSLLGLAGVLWTRGDELNLPARTILEIMLEKPLTISVTPAHAAGERPPWK